jgi:hypothetical protein
MKADPGSTARSAWALLLALAGVKLVLHLLLSNRYGYFRDELYFLDCGRHLDWGYVDHAPLIGLYARLALLLGGSLPVLRAIAGLAGSALVVLTGLLAWRLGGGRFAQGLAGLAAIVAPIYLAFSSLFTMNVFEPLFWMGGVYVLVRLLQTGDSRLWLLFGLVAGLGLQNKHSTLLFGFAVAFALLLTPSRRELRRRWIWLGLAVALLMFLPNLLWQWAHGFPTVEDLQNVARTGKNVVLGPVSFVAEQALLMHPVLAPLWLGGLAWLLFARGGRYRLLGWTFVVFFAASFLLKAKSYYLAPIYPMLLAAGAVGLESSLRRWSPARERAARAAVVALVVGAGALTAPLFTPLLDPERYVAYERWLGMERSKTEVAHVGPLPQMIGDQFGWPELVAEVARVYHALPEEERAQAAIFASNYGEAGAINLFGPRHGLPAAISGHQTHFFWGHRGYTGEVAIVLQRSREDLEGSCASVEEAGRHFHAWGMAEENRPIHVCRGLAPPLPELWPRLKHWN